MMVVTTVILPRTTPRETIGKEAMFLDRTKCNLKCNKFWAQK
jgi:hypothetical protein